MPCAQNVGHASPAFSITSNYKISSLYIDRLTTTNLYIDTKTTILNRNVSAMHGTIKSDYVIINDQCEVALGDDIKINGKVFLVDKQAFNDIWWTWSTSSMLKYIDEHDIKGVNYDSEPYKAHYIELVQLHDNPGMDLL